MTYIELWADGAGQRGPGGWAYIMRWIHPSTGEVTEREASGGIAEHTTNNRAELTAVIEGLSALTEPSEVTVISDSNYVVHAFTRAWIWRWQRDWGQIKNRDLWERLLEVMEPHRVEFEWVAGHNGVALNERCDYLAGQARQQVMTELAARALDTGEAA